MTTARLQARQSNQATTVLLTAVAFFMVVLDALVVVTALPSIHRSLGGSLGTLQWTVNAYNMAFGAGIITAAALGDRLGRRRVYVSGLALFTLASAACALAPGTSLLIASRAVQGLGAAIITPLSLTILTAAFPAERRGAIIGIWGGISGLGVAAGPLIGGAVTQGLSWHWVFWVNVPVGVAAVIGAKVFLPETRGARVRLDIPGLALVSAGAAALIWAVVEGSQRGWSDGQVVGGLLLGAVAIAIFLLWEARAAEPMIPLGLFRVRSFSAAVGATFLLAASIYSAAFLTSQFFQFSFGDSPLATGLRFLPWTATPLLVAPIAGAISDRVGARTLMVPGLLMQGAGFAWIVALAASHARYPAYVAPFVLAGVGISMAIPTSSAAALNALPPEALGKASAILNTLRQFGAVFGIAAVTAVFNAHGSLAGPAAVTDGFRPALATAAGFSLLAASAALAVRRAGT
ncbi:MAG: DHA2 family efflux MFS transporter permease subunit, partial [Acidimicrobiaceae bacterium]|nr:DHA2 family efflux MFS transporter permease subunit [Acidimicrobiaceae bacterium]